MKITIFFKDGTSREFPIQNRPGGSYSSRLEFKGAFVVVTDEYYNDFAFPAADVREIRTEQRPRF